MSEGQRNQAAQRREPNQEQENEQRMDRLIAAIESLVNAVNRQVQTLESKKKRRSEGNANRTRRGTTNRPLVITPLMQAAVKRALVKARG